MFVNSRKRSVKILHASLHALALACAVFGLVTVFDSHNLATKPIPNLYSLHSWIGIITVSLFGLQVRAGAPMYGTMAWMVFYVCTSSLEEYNSEKYNVSVVVWAGNLPATWPIGQSEGTLQASARFLGTRHLPDVHCRGADGDNRETLFLQHVSPELHLNMCDCAYVCMTGHE